MTKDRLAIAANQIRITHNRSATGVEAGAQAGHEDFHVVFASKAFPCTAVLALFAREEGRAKAPAALHPVRNRDRAIERRNYVIDRLQENGWIKASDADRYQLFNEYDAENFRHTSCYLGLTYSDQLLIVEIPAGP